MFIGSPENRRVFFYLRLGNRLGVIGGFLKVTHLSGFTPRSAGFKATDAQQEGVQPRSLNAIGSL